MSFRGRLWTFFAIIVIVPMVAVALVLFTLNDHSERGKADASIAAGLRTAIALHADAKESARPALRRLVREPSIPALLADGVQQADAEGLRRALADHPELAGAELRDDGGASVRAARGQARPIAPASEPVVSGGDRLGTLSASVTEPSEFVRAVKRLTGMEAAVAVAGDPTQSAATVRGASPAAFGEKEEATDSELPGERFRGRSATLGRGDDRAEVAVFQSSERLEASVAHNRRLIFGVLALFFLMALAAALFISRALQEQIQTFLLAARRVARGDFEHSVPTDGRDEFAQLGAEFNSMSEQLAAKIDEVERKRQELEETIRRVGDAFATGLDRQGVVELTVETAVDACDAEAGRVLSLDHGVLLPIGIGAAGDAELHAALEAAERKAFAVRPEVGFELLEQVDPDAPPPMQRRASEATVGDAHALSMPMRARLGARSSTQYVGVVSIARRGRAFSRAQGKLLEYLAGQAVVSIENSDMHETVQHQAVTDELTGLANVRQLHGILDNEIERARRFGHPLGLVMLDVDDFKLVNDTYGHQQGDEVLAAVATALREISREIDEPARYGGEEMAVVLPQTDIEGAEQLAERMRETVELLQVPRLNGEGHLDVTASFGVASIPYSAADKEHLIASADAALYRAKRAGKNRVEVAEPVAAPN